jgi:GTP diphosphokinase / guanosine-3',5'-bis(diphosphate) 3'-diphosphatase
MQPQLKGAPGSRPKERGPAAAGSAASPVQRPIMRQYELVERVKSYDPGADENLLNRAYVFAMKAHGAQVRASGDPYFSHPVEVAGILAALRLDSASIATGLLHDTVEDTGATIADLERLFGPEIARLVDGVTKLNKLDLQSAHTEQAENFRKLLLAMSEDIRVLLVKLADRLHNMRTLQFIDNVDKRRRIASETMEIYAPLAERIGMQGLKDELDDLAFAALWHDARQSVLSRLHQLRQHDSNLIERIVDELSATLHDAGLEAKVYGREKSPLSIWHKMKRKNISFEQLSDIMAFRITVDSVPDCYAALGVIHGRYAMVPERFKDFISTPKPNGYRSLHTTIFGPERRRIEVQIRTTEMHEVAELGVAAHWAYKQSGRLTDGRRYRWVRGLLEILEHASGPEEFLEHTKLEMFQDQVFCFTPRGDLIALPQGATPVDFAYAVHSEVGDATVGAKVNGRLVPLRTKLSHGDQVEIITSKGAAPSAAWERFVVTGKARSRIRRYLRSRRRNDYIAHGRELLQRAAHKERLKVGDKRLEPVLVGFQHKTVDDLLAAIGEGSLGPRLVLEAMRRGEEPPSRPEPVPGKVVPLRRLRPAPAATGWENRVQGLLPGLAVAFARCCHPIPGDPIVGVVRTGRGITIHRSDCAMLARSAAEEEDRCLDLGWNQLAAGVKATTRLQVMTLNQPGSLGSLSTVIGREGGNITDLRFGAKSDDLYEIVLDVEVDDRDHMDRIMAGLRASPVVTAVERMQG